MMANEGERNFGGGPGRKMLRYRIKLKPGDNGTLLVTSPDLPGVVTFGEDRADARVTPSCGCIFCDLERPTVAVDGVAHHEARAASCAQHPAPCAVGVARPHSS